MILIKMNKEYFKRFVKTETEEIKIIVVFFNVFLEIIFENNLTTPTVFTLKILFI